MLIRTQVNSRGRYNRANQVNGRAVRVRINGTISLTIIIGIVIRPSLSRDSPLLEKKYKQSVISFEKQLINYSVKARFVKK